MFTGIVEELGTVAAVEDQGDAARLTLSATTVTDDARLGDSIAVNGCCLTVSGLDDGTWSADVMRETLDRTGVGSLAPGDRVNLERAVRADGRLGGHVVQGHVDGTGTVRRRSPSEHGPSKRWEVVEVATDPDLLRYVVEKGSIAVDGVSLTVVDVLADAFTVSLIPETLARTTLGHREPGSTVNLEVDVVAKYVEKLLAPHRTTAGGAA